METLFSNKGISLSNAYMATTAKEASDSLAGHSCIACGQVGVFISGDKGKLRQLGDVQYYKVGMKCVCGFINFVYLIYNDINRKRKSGIPSSQEALDAASRAGIVPDPGVEMMLAETKVLGFQGKLLEAVDKAKACTARYPGNAAAHYNLGYLLSACGNMDEALVHYRRCVECDPTFSAAWYRMGIICEERGLWEEALRDYETFLEHQPGHQEGAKRKKRCIDELDRRSVS